MSSVDVLNTVNGFVNNLMIDDYPMTLLVLIPLIPGIMLGMPLLGVAAYRAKVFHKSVGLFAIAVGVLLIVGKLLPGNINTFSACHLAFAVFGAALAFEKRAGANAGEESAAA